MGRKLLTALLDGGHTLVLSNAVLAEVTKVLRYPRLQKLHALTDEQIYDYAQFLRDVSEMVVVGPPYHAPLRGASACAMSAHFLRCWRIADNGIPANKGRIRR